jgi:hypothetical protein
MPGYIGIRYQARTVMDISAREGNTPLLADYARNEAQLSDTIPEA